MRRFAKLERRFKDNGEAQAKGENITFSLSVSSFIISFTGDNYDFIDI